MTDVPPLAPAPEKPALSPSASGRGLRIALAVSVALNLAVAGLALGAWLGDGGPHRAMPRDLSFGPFSEALSDADRKALRHGLLNRAGEFRTSRQAAQAEFTALLQALRAAPFDAADLRDALGAIESRTAQRLELGRSLIEARLVEMTDAERLAFADRLEQSLRRGGGKD